MKKDIFIIDDDPVYRMIVNIMIKDIDANLQITECENGDLGLGNLERLQHSKNEVIVLLDINMPVLDGWEFLEKIKKSKFNKLKDLKLFMVSSSIDESDKIKSEGYTSVNSFYQKTLEREDLQAMIGID